MEQLVWFAPCWRATSETDFPGSKRSRTIASFCSAVQRDRRSGPVNTSITSYLVLVKSTVLCLPASLGEMLCPVFQGAAPIAANGIWLPLDGLVRVLIAVRLTIRNKRTASPVLAGLRLSGGHRRTSCGLDA